MPAPQILAPCWTLQAWIFHASRASTASCPRTKETLVPFGGFLQPLMVIRVVAAGRRSLGKHNVQKAIPPPSPVSQTVMLSAGVRGGRLWCPVGEGSGGRDKGQCNSDMASRGRTTQWTRWQQCPAGTCSGWPGLLVSSPGILPGHAQDWGGGALGEDWDAALAAGEAAGKAQAITGHVAHF